MAISLHKAGFERAETMIKKGLELDFTSNNWNEVKPDADDELNYLSSHSLDEYGLWFLGIDASQPVNHKSKFVYPFGDFEVVQESALMAIVRQANQDHHKDIAHAAEQLLKKIENTKRNK